MRGSPDHGEPAQLRVRQRLQPGAPGEYLLTRPKAAPEHDSYGVENERLFRSANQDRLYR